MAEKKTLVERIHTPMGIRVGEITKYKFVSLTDVYNECLKDLSYFKRMLRAVEPVSPEPIGLEGKRKKELAKQELAAVVLSKNHVLAHKCFDSLFKALSDPERVKLAETCMKKKLTWAQMWALWDKRDDSDDGSDTDCPWPTCPDAAT